MAASARRIRGSLVHGSATMPDLGDPGSTGPPLGAWWGAGMGEVADLESTPPLGGRGGKVAVLVRGPGRYAVTNRPISTPASAAAPAIPIVCSAVR
jgi:hypothetical protein